MATAELVDDDVEREIESNAQSTQLAALQRIEVDMQISTAKQYPRSIRKFLNEARQMVSLTEEIASECTYMLPRAGKKLMGPSARFAEIVASAWGNCRAAARIVEEQERFVVAQGVFNDVERNVAITYEVRRRITNKEGDRFNDDMIGVASNAACSIAMRNAVLKGIPKAFWKSLHDEAMQTARGNEKTLTQRRDALVKAFIDIGVSEKELFGLIDVSGKEDVTLDHILELKAIYTAIRDGDTSVDQLLKRESVVGSKVRKSSVNDKLSDPPKLDEGEATPEELAAMDKGKKSDGLFDKAENVGQ